MSIKPELDDSWCGRAEDSLTHQQNTDPQTDKGNIMTDNRIQLKNVKFAEFASEETFCYSASVYFDGKRVATVKNDGHGGADYQYPTDDDGWRELCDYVDQLPAETIDAPWEDEGISTMQPSVESVCHGLVADWLIDRDIKKALRGKVAFYEGEWTGRYKYYPTKTRSAEEVTYHIRTKHPEAVILNELPQEQLRTLFGGE